MNTEMLTTMSDRKALARHTAEFALAGPVGSFDHYVERVSRVPVLSREEEHALATRLRDLGDVDAARALVLAHLRFVVHIARGYLGYGLPISDLVQEGNVGLMKAVKRYNPDVGVRLVSFAVHWIRAEIHEYVLRNWRMVKIATTKAQRKLFFNLRRMKRNLGWLSAAETEAVAKELGVQPTEVQEMEQRLAARDLSYDPVPRDEDEESLEPAAYLPAPDANPAELVEAAESERVGGGQLVEAVQSLDARSRDILQRRWIADSKATLHELAAEYGVSAERIRQIETAAIKRLRKLLPARSGGGLPAAV
jgi:RNA polymerase sigma-32 factor